MWIERRQNLLVGGQGIWLSTVTNEEKTVMANPVLRGRCSASSFLTQWEREPRGGASTPPDCHQLTILRVGKGAEPQPSLWTASEKFLHSSMEKMGAPSGNVGEQLPRDLADVMSRGQICSNDRPPQGVLPGTHARMRKLCPCCWERQGNLCRAQGWCRAWEVSSSTIPFPDCPPPPPHPGRLCVGLPSWLRWGLWPCVSPSVPRALGGICQGAAGTQWSAGCGRGKCHAELRGGPGPDRGDVVQGRQEAEFELKSACGGHGPQAAAGGAAGGQGGCWGVQLRGWGPEGLLPPGCHRSVLEADAELGHAGDERPAICLPKLVCPCPCPSSLQASLSCMSHLCPCGRVIGEGVLATKRGRFCPHLFLAVRLNHTGLAPAQNLLVIPGVETLGLFGVWGWGRPGDTWLSSHHKSLLNTQHIPSYCPSCQFSVVKRCFNLVDPWSWEILATQSYLKFS